jgi:hypothetical protein
MQSALELIDLLEGHMTLPDERIGELVRPQIEQLISIPGVQERAARDVMAEIETDRSRFGSASR